MKPYIFLGKSFDLKLKTNLQRKTTRYEILVAEINGNGYKCSNIPLEIGTRGVVNTKNKGVLTKLCHWIKVAMVSQVKLAILGSTPSGTPGTLLIGVAGDT